MEKAFENYLWLIWTGNLWFMSQVFDTSFNLI